MTSSKAIVADIAALELFKFSPAAGANRWVLVKSITRFSLMGSRVVSLPGTIVLGFILSIKDGM